MPQPVIQYKVLVASPSDVKPERKAISEVIYQWNINVGRILGVVLDAVMWETHATPEMGDRPQAIINKQLVEGSDILIGTFWTRIGTHTGVAASGTVEEINQFIRVGKPALLYFSSTPISPDKIDATQYQQVRQFMDQCKDNGLYFGYKSVSELRKYVYEHLTSTVEKLQRLTSQDDKDDKDDTQPSISTQQPFKLPLDMSGDQARSYREERVVRIVSGETPIRLTEGAKLILHLIPQNAFDKTAKIDLSPLNQSWYDLSTVYVAPSDYRHNFDGILTYRTQSNAGIISVVSYAQMNRNGIVEAVDGSLLAPWTDRNGTVTKTIPSGIFDLEILKALRGYCSLQNKLGVQPPLFVMLSLIGVLDYIMPLDNFWLRRQAQAIDRDAILLDEVLLNTFDGDLAQQMRATLNLIWNAAGWERSFSYDEHGKWKGKWVADQEPAGSSSQ